MHRWTDLAQVPAGYGPSVVTLGNFDGVHRGHRSVLARMVADARDADARAVVVTFSPHPAQVHHPQDAPPLLTGPEDRLELLEETGLDAVLQLAYSLEFARQTPEEFVRRYLVRGLNARTVVVGRDVRFGWGNAGDLGTMVELGERYGFDVEVIEDQAADPTLGGDVPVAGTGTDSGADIGTDVGTRAGTDADGVDDDVARAEAAHLRQVAEPLHRRWSSTWVRELLAAGRVAEAADVLGRPHRMRGVVVHGDARGRELGYPTANLAAASSGLTTGMVPADGVYAGLLRVTREPGPDGTLVAVSESAGPRLPAAISVGTNPTFDGVERRVEAYVLDRTDLELYDREVVVEFVARIRPTLRFSSVEELVATIDDDVERVRAALGEADVTGLAGAATAGADAGGLVK